MARRRAAEGDSHCASVCSAKVAFARSIVAAVCGHLRRRRCASDNATSASARARARQASMTSHHLRGGDGGDGGSVARSFRGWRASVLVVAAAAAAIIIRHGDDTRALECSTPLEIGGARSASPRARLSSCSVPRARALTLRLVARCSLERRRAAASRRASRETRARVERRRRDSRSQRSASLALFAAALIAKNKSCIFWSDGDTSSALKSKRRITRDVTRRARGRPTVKNAR